MRTRALLALPVALLLAAAFAGCTGDGPPGDAGPGAGIGSETARAGAVEAGRAWDADAELWFLGTVEAWDDASMFLGRAQEDGDADTYGLEEMFLEEFLPEADADVGDGRSTAWYALFRSDDRAKDLLVVVREGEPVATREMVMEENENTGPVTDYELDGAEALEKARDHRSTKEEFAAVLDADDGGLFYGLFGPGDDPQQREFLPNPLWMVVAASASQELFVLLLVDGVTGEAFTFEELFAKAFAQQAGR